jgi:hypothetical protein
MNDDLLNQIDHIVKQEAHNKNFYFHHAPPAKLHNATLSYAPGMGRDETFIFLYDDTLFGSAKDGFILTTKRLYYRNQTESPMVASLADICDMTVDSGTFTGKLVFVTHQGSFSVGILSATEKLALFNVMQKTLGLLGGLEGTAAPAQNETPSPKPRVLECAGCGARHDGNARTCIYCDSPL